MTRLIQKITAKESTRVMTDDKAGTPTKVLLLFESGETPCEVTVHDGDLPEHSRLESVMRFRAVTAYTQRAYPTTKYTISPLSNMWYAVRLDSGAKQLTKRIRAMILTEEAQ